MPRPDKDSAAGGDSEPIDDIVPASRTHSWTKYGGPETMDGDRGSSSVVEVTVDGVTIVEGDDVTVSKYMARGTSAHGVGTPDTARRVEVHAPTTEWTVIRTIDGRTYRRIDTLVTVPVPVPPAD